MKATAFEFRYRFWIIVAIYVVGFTAPWDAVWHVDGSGPNAHVWGQLAVALSRGGAMSIVTAFNVVLAVGIVCALLGAGLRTWGSAYLGVRVMQGEEMHGEAVVADGPYRYLRNPLYVGTWLNAAALALLMPVSGALFAVAGLVLFQMRLILGEEAYLRERLGAAYGEYCARVPRLFPAVRKPTSQNRDVGHPVPVAGSDAKPRWGRAALAEIFMWGVAGSFAVAGWRYDARLMIQCVLVWLGVSLVVQGLGVAGAEGGERSAGRLDS